MSWTKLISNYARYNHWANKTMTEWLKMLDSKLLYQETLSSFSSIDLTVQHMNQSQNFWFGVITESDVRNPDATVKVKSAGVNMDDLADGSLQWLNKIKTYNEADLLKKVPSNDMVQCRYE